jgi:hypothetical protein
MAGRSRDLLLGVLACVLAVLGALLGIGGAKPPAGAQGVRSLQVWPERSLGTVSGLLESSTGHDESPVNPLGTYRSPSGDVVYARSYFQFPLDVFPPGTEIVRATLHVYIDSASEAGEVTLGAYRVVEPWTGTSSGSDPADWPVLLDSPIAVTTARIEVLTPTITITPTVPTATVAPTAPPTDTPTDTPTPESRLTLTPPTSPLPTPLTSPLPTPTPISTVTPTVAAPIVQLTRAVETWITFDVTALMRAWLVGEVVNDGLVVASVPVAGVSPEMVEGVLVARWLNTQDTNTLPYIIAEYEVNPVTPTLPASPLSTPTSEPALVLPPAGSSGSWKGLGLVLIGASLLLLGLARRT